MKKVLLQLDTDEHPSPFDAIVAHDAGVDVLLSHGDVKPEDARGLVAGRLLHPRGGRPQDDGRVGRRQGRGRRRGALRRGAEGVLRPLPGLGDARLQRLQHDRRDDDRADREGAQPRRQPRGRARPGGRRAAVGRAAAEARAARSRVAALPPDLFGDDRPYRRPRGARGRAGARPRRPRAGRPRRARGDPRRSADRPVRRARRRAGAAARLLGAAPDASSCWPTTTRRSRWASRARRRPTTWPTTTASSCSARWRSAARR